MQNFGMKLNIWLRQWMVWSRWVWKRLNENQIQFRWYSDDRWSLNKILKLHMLTVIVRSVFQEDNKYCPQVFLDECLYEL